jgi:hypothetical protein
MTYTAAPTTTPSPQQQSTAVSSPYINYWNSVVTNIQRATSTPKPGSITTASPKLPGFGDVAQQQLIRPGTNRKQDAERRSRGEKDGAGSDVVASRRRILPDSGQKLRLRGGAGPWEGYVQVNLKKS